MRSKARHRDHYNSKHLAQGEDITVTMITKCLSGLLNADIYADSNLLCMKVA